jgi:hypothetical protein
MYSINPLRSFILSLSDNFYVTYTTEYPVERPDSWIIQTNPTPSSPDDRRANVFWLEGRRNRGWGKFEELELLNFYCRINIIRIMKWSRVGWAGDVAQVLEIGNAYKMYKGQNDMGRCKWRNNMKSVVKAIVSYYVCTRSVGFTMGHMTASRERRRMNLIFPCKQEDLLTNWATIYILRTVLHKVRQWFCVKPNQAMT